MAEYKDTLNLPVTEFPMKANLPGREPERLQQWKAQGIYQKIRQAKKGASRFILHDGPPYANGHLHCGHALNKILKDIIVKSKTMSGFDAPFVPGWDCHGLPIELNVEKETGKAGTKLTMAEFREKCRHYAQSQIEIQKEEFKRLGVFGEWDRPYVTMDFRYEANIVRALGKMIANGHLQQGFKPVHWCVECGSALAEAEVEYEDKLSPSIDVAFKVIDPEAFLAAFNATLSVKPTLVPIWTTTPWTLPANEAVCLHPEIAYCLIDAGDHYLVVAEELAASVSQRYGLSDETILANVKGAALEKQLLQHPFQARQVPVILGAHVTTESGTGAVHTAPAHGPDDYQVGLQYQLPLINPVNSKGCYQADVPEIGGLHVTKANDKIIQMLKETGTLLHLDQIKHSYPHCWRHKTPMIFLATPQWFISMDKSGLRRMLMKAIDKVEWIPDWGKARIQAMVETRPDWCISRQRAWGTPMPLFIHQQTRELHPDTQNLLEKVAVMIEEKGIDAWFDLDKESLLGADANDYDKVMDTMDVWLDSGVSHFAVLRQNPQLQFPADLYFEGSDQHRGWFNSSLTTALAMYAEAPYKTVLTHGYTVDAEGKKLSKSKGNYVALDKLIAEHGADVLRLWVASTDYRHEVSISQEIIKRTSEAYRRIRNTARFLLANLFDFDPATDLHDGEHLLELDRWAIRRTQLLQEEIIQDYEAYNFHSIFQKIHNFCTVDMGGFYLDIIKDRQYTTSKNSQARRSCQTAMYHIIQAFTRWLAPILSFTADEIWSYIPGQKGESVFLDAWYSQWPSVGNIDMAYWQEMIEVRDAVNRALEEKRKEGVIGSPLEASVTLYANPDMHQKLLHLGNELRFMLITSAARVAPMSHDSRIHPQSRWVNVEVEAVSHKKCARCWHRCEDVGEHHEHPELCLRCVGNISGADELRTTL